MKPNIRYLTYINSSHAKTNSKGFYLKIRNNTSCIYDIRLEGLVLLAQEKIIPQKIIKHTIDYNDTVSLLSFHKMQPDYIYCKYNVYIAFDNSTGINCLLEHLIKFESLFC